MESVCRICMSRTRTLEDIYAKRLQPKDEPSLVEMLNECVECEVKPDDPLPKQICLFCVVDAQNAFKFKRRCEQSHQLFLEQLTEDSAIEELFETEDIQATECAIDVSVVKKEQPDILEEESSQEMLQDDPLLPLELSIDVGCVKIEKMDSCEEDNSVEMPPAQLLHMSNEEAILPDASCDTKMDRKEDTKMNRKQKTISPKTQSDTHIAARSINNRKEETTVPETKSGTKAARKMPIIRGAETAGVFINTETKLSLNTHVCELCGKGFTKKKLLSQHKLVHVTAVRPYKCPSCPKSFYGSFDLQSHCHVHSEERPFVCTHCSLTFKYISNLQRHIRTHANKPPYQCTQCPKAFVKKQDAVQHRLCHKDIRFQYKCSLCQKNYKSKLGFRKHTCRTAHEMGEFTHISNLH